MSLNESKKLVIVGDGYCGKTSMIVKYLEEKKLIGDYSPTVLDNFALELRVGGRPRHLVVWDTSGQEDWYHLRKLVYLGADVVVIVFNVADRDTLWNVLHQWYPEVKRHCPDAPILLAGNKKDLRKDSREDGKEVNSAEGEHMAKVIGARVYLECSALTSEGIHQVFNTAGRYIFRKKWCIVL